MNVCHSWRRLVVVFIASLTIAVVDAFVPIRTPVVSFVKPSLLASSLQSRTRLAPLCLSTETEDRALIGDDSAYFSLEEQVRAQGD